MDIIPTIAAPAFEEETDDNGAMEAYYNEQDAMSISPVPLNQNDGCIPVALNVYTDFAIASVSLNDNWRVYPTDENLMQLGIIVPQENLYFHYS